MILRQSSLFAPTAGSILLRPIQSSTSSSPRSRGSTRHHPSCRRRYATLADDTAGDGNNHDPRLEQESRQQQHVWPQPRRGQTCPTPYDIFAMSTDASYSKARFYELVKMYHPDLSQPAEHPAHVSPAVRVERYRLIVAAHAILSDPVKRRAYDRFGAGWNGRAEFHAARSSTGAPGPFSHSWVDPADPIWRNATWEDWERFHARKEGGGAPTEPRAPVYMANSWFLACVVALVMIGGSMNYGRAQDAGHYLVEQRDVVHDRAAKDLRRVRQEAQMLTAKQDRIEFFVRQREATMSSSGYDEQLREDRANRLLADQQVCQSEGVREQGT